MGNSSLPSLVWWLFHVSHFSESLPEEREGSCVCVTHHKNGDTLNIPWALFLGGIIPL